jgi:hypothetical protein
MRLPRLLALLLTLIAASTGSAEVLRVDQYIDALRVIDSLLASNRRDVAILEARILARSEVDSPYGRFSPDTSLLAAVRDTRIPIPQVRARIRHSIDELQRATGIEGSAADRNVLRDVQKSQEVAPLEAGGELTPPDIEIPMSERILKAAEAVFDWIGDMIRKLLDWLFDLLPDSRAGGAMGSGLRLLVIGVALLIVLFIVVLAVRVLRGSQSNVSTVAESNAPIGSERDADPLSRGANEWERYATQLGLEGRYREAIRAWFHAVLVTCYAEGILHFRKGRTNWEYIAALSPSHGWRPDLITLTRRFEQEWYGSDTSAAEVLADCEERARRILDALHERGGAAA